MEYGLRYLYSWQFGLLYLLCTEGAVTFYRSAAWVKGTLCNYQSHKNIHLIPSTDPMVFQWGVYENWSGACFSRLFHLTSSSNYYCAITNK